MTTHKTCRICQTLKIIEDFYVRKSAKDGYRNECKDCLSNSHKIYYKKNLKKIKAYNKKNKSSQRLYKKKYRNENKKYIQEYAKSYRELNREKIRGYKNNKKNKEKRNKQLKQRFKTDPVFKLRHYVASSIRDAMRRKNAYKNGQSSIKYLSYSIKELYGHLESKFEPWMNWKNWGVYNPKLWDDNDQSTWKWQLDHIIPQEDLPYKTMEDENFKKCWALENLRPLSAKQNVLDGVYKLRHKQ
jgi:hypothetical protein